MADEQPPSDEAQRNQVGRPFTTRIRTDTEEAECNTTSSRSATFPDNPITPESPWLSHRDSMALAGAGDQFSSLPGTPTSIRRAAPSQASMGTDTSRTSSSVSEFGGDTVRKPSPGRTRLVNGKRQKRRASTLDDNERFRHSVVAAEGSLRESPESLVGSARSSQSNAYADDEELNVEEGGEQSDRDRSDDQDDNDREVDEAIRDTSTPRG